MLSPTHHREDSLGTAQNKVLAFLQRSLDCLFPFLALMSDVLGLTLPDLYLEIEVLSSLV